jgi:2',3'-cyclic-nucleotide 2'-phosphodiesterase (5'-nucleotidase family)
MSIFNRTFSAFIFVLFAILLTTGCVAFPPGGMSSVPRAITILISSNTGSNFTPCGCHSGKWGGMPRRGSMFSTVQQEESVKQPPWPVFIVDTGDVTQGSNAEIQAKKDQYIFESYKVIGYDLVNVGMDELRLGAAQINKFGTELGIPWGSVNTFASGAYPPLSTTPVPPAPGASTPPQQNPPAGQSPDGSTTHQPPDTPSTPPPSSGDADPAPPTGAEPKGAPGAADTSDGTTATSAPSTEPLFATSRIVERPANSGFKVGFIGAMIQDGARLNAVQGVSFEPYNDAIVKEITNLKKSRVSFIVLVCDSDANDLDTLLSQEVKDGVNVVIGGRKRLDQSPNARFDPLNKNFDPSTVSTESGEPAVLQSDTTATDKPRVDEKTIINKLQTVAAPLFVPKAGGRGRLVTHLDITLNSSAKIVDYQYEEMEVSDKFEDDPRMDAIALKYDTEVLSEELNARVTRNYSGSQACYRCHPNFEAVWAGTGHFKAYDTIVKDNKLDDRSCTRCHAAGYNEEPRLLTYNLIPEALRNIGCEACHPNGARHIQLQDNINKMTPEQRKNVTTSDPIATPAVAETCTICHTGEWGVGFIFAEQIEKAKAICMGVANPTTVPPPEAPAVSGGQ